MLPSQYLEKGWAQHSEAVNNKGKPVRFFDTNACAWCITGAIYASVRCSKSIDETIEQTIFVTIFEKLQCNVVMWNDYIASSQQQAIDLMKDIEKELNLSEYNNAISF